MENAHDMEQARATPDPAQVTARDWDERVDRASRKLPERVQRGVAWLREPARFPVRLLAAILLILGGIFSIRLIVVRVTIVATALFALFFLNYRFGWVTAEMLDWTR